MDNEKLAWLQRRLNFSPRRRVPLILQTEAAECGLACMAMSAGWHGHHTDLFTLRSESGLSSRGATLGTLHAIAGNLGLAGRALSLDLEELQHCDCRVCSTGISVISSCWSVSKVTRLLSMILHMADEPSVVRHCRKALLVLRWSYGPIVILAARKSHHVSDLQS